MPHEAATLKTADFDFDLPPELIAQCPAPDRTGARMMVLRRADGSLQHRTASWLPELLGDGDLLVLNNTRVVPSRLMGVREKTGGKAELLLIEEGANGCWDALCRTSRPPKIADVFLFDGGRVRAEVRELGQNGRIVVAFDSPEPVPDLLQRMGRTPLPPYIRREKQPEAGMDLEPHDRVRYQTVYAEIPGAIAAPTAGLHFSHALLEALSRKGVRVAKITLHVGPGTFRPVEAETIADHRMDAERYEVSSAAADAINTTRAAGGRIIAVGTTSVRTLETVSDARGFVRPGSGRSALFLYPPYRFKAVDALLTNFHLPRSTLLMLVSAFAGMEFVRAAYREAVSSQYRFYSYGDCMFIL